MAFRIRSFRLMLPFNIVFGVLLGTLGGQAAPLQAESGRLDLVNPLTQSDLIAQNSGTIGANCYWSTLQMGVYQEPNTQSVALGVLPAGAIVFIGPGSGQGWVRLQAPVVGWMATAGLQANPLQGCNGLGSIVPVGGAAPSPTPATPPAVNSPAPSQEPILCTVLPPSGLAVRNQPILHPRTLTAILEPGLHRFQFTDRQVRLESFNQVRDWFYITAPVSGWISPRVVGNPTVDLRGEGCL
ncbi:MAG: SH3 domain-containing protein [Prochlorotrichaceae cyanobacterium]|jgi:hypothetical protein